MKKLVLFSFLGLLLGGLWVVYYDQFINLEYWNAAANATDVWEKKLRTESNAPCYIFTGGSEVRMGSIYPKVMYDEFGVRAINAGANAGFGRAGNISIALDYAKPGDYLIVSIRDFITDETKLITTAGKKYCFMRQGFKMFKSPFIKFNFSTLKDLTFGEAGDSSMYIVYKLFFPSKLNSWKNHIIIHESGWCEQTYRKELSMKPILTPANEVTINDATKKFLNTLKAECEKRHISLVMFINAHYSTTQDIPYLAMLAFRLVEEGIPVLKDPHFGCDSDRSLFSDSLNHLSLKGSIKYSRIFAQCLVNKSYWSKEELILILKEYGIENFNFNN